MKELTLEILSAYLPFKVKVKTTFGIFSIDGIDIENQQIIICGEYYDFGSVELCLRPLSDLTKEIEFNGKKFVPVKKIRHEFIIIDGSHRQFDYPLSLDGAFCGVLSLPYWVIQKLHEWNFDTFGLIEAGLAIDINTLKK